MPPFAPSEEAVGQLVIGRQSGLLQRLAGSASAALTVKREYQRKGQEVLSGRQADYSRAEFSPSEEPSLWPA